MSTHSERVCSHLIPLCDFHHALQQACCLSFQSRNSVNRYLKRSLPQNRCAAFHSPIRGLTHFAGSLSNPKLISAGGSAKRHPLFWAQKFPLAGRRSELRKCLRYLRWQTGGIWKGPELSALTRTLTQSRAISGTRNIINGRLREAGGLALRYFYESL